MHELHRTSRMVKKLMWASLGVKKDVERSVELVTWHGAGTLTEDVPSYLVLSSTN